MQNSIYISSSDQIQSNLKFEDIIKGLQDPEGLVWVSLENPSDSELSSILTDCFQFHPLAIEDCQTLGYQAPKVDDFGSYIFIIAHAIHPHPDMELETLELNLFLGHNYLVSVYRGEDMSLMERVRHRLMRDERLRHNGADFLCHAILDVLVDDYMPIIDQLDDEIEVLEDQVLARPESKTLERILTIKHNLLSLRRVINPLREIMNRLSRDEFPQIDRRSRIYFRDIYDHLVRIQDLCESIRDIAIGTLDTYLNSISMRLNEIMKALTIVSTIFLPLSFVAGIYGMNFQYMPEIRSPLGYPMVWAIFIIIAGSMLIFFKIRRWF